MWYHLLRGEMRYLPTHLINIALFFVVFYNIVEDGLFSSMWLSWWLLDVFIVCYLDGGVVVVDWGLG